VPEADLLVLIEAELRGLDGDLNVEPGLIDALEHVVIVARDLVGFADVRDVLAEPREDGGERRLVELARRGERIVDVLARHEPRDRAADEAGAHRPLAKPSVGGGPEKGVTGYRHGDGPGVPRSHGPRVLVRGSCKRHPTGRRTIRRA